MRFTISAICLLFSITVFGQHPTCDGDRFKNDIFDDVTHTAAIKYGENETFSGVNQELFFDLYEPTDDTAEKRPTIVLAFGGSFIQGQREDLADLCMSFARKGFVAVTIDYRLYDGALFPVPEADKMRDVVVRTIGDMKAVIRHLKQDAATDNLYRIDPDFIISGGVSAGAITAAHTAVLDESDDIPEELLELIEKHGGLEGNTTDNYEYDSSVIAYVNYSGALNNASLMTADDPPFISYHDDGDGVVPYSDGWATIANFPIAPLQGSAVMHYYADSLNIKNELNTIENSSGHVSYFGEISSTVDVINNTSAFLEGIVCEAGVSSVQDQIISQWKAFPNPSSSLVQFENDNASVEKLVVYDMLGNLRDIINYQNRLDIGNYENGIYLVEIHDGAERPVTIKIIKN